MLQQLALAFELQQPVKLLSLYSSSIAAIDCWALVDGPGTVLVDVLLALVHVVVQNLWQKRMLLSEVLRHQMMMKEA